jgi:anti-sigma B factor antagonist
MSLEVRHDAMTGACILRVSGEVDLFTRPEFHNHLMRLAQNRPVIVDCSRLEYLGAGGARALGDCRDRAERAGHRLVLVAPPSPVRKIRDLVLAQRIPVVETVEAAVALLGGAHRARGGGTRGRSAAGRRRAERSHRRGVRLGRHGGGSVRDS